MWSVGDGAEDIGGWFKVVALERWGPPARAWGLTAEAGAWLG